MAAVQTLPAAANTIEGCSSLSTSLSAPPPTSLAPSPLNQPNHSPTQPPIEQRELPSVDLGVTMTTTSPLLRLPLELRTLIYSHLTPAQPLSYPLGPNTAITALSHRPPPRALLLTCRVLACEALDHFYRVARFRVMLNPPAPLADPHFQRLAHLPQLRRIRNLGVLLDWDFPKVPSYARGAGAEGFEFGMEAEVPFFRQVMDRGRCADMLRLTKRLVGVLGAARELRTVCVSWTDLVEGCWEEKKAVLDVMVGGVKAKGVKVVRGDVVALDEDSAVRLFDVWNVVGEGGR
ncbi:phosphatidylinositol phospholipase c protein [Diplodia corticola]|uniref:Phosphatidylinositol phospholipase c protein n=1 Tax=Diplodia corticola TaxID=236234 RepID=A0A1J9RCA6_9PEZI|nr:phosphatidylinositol phospholipase c protein [Diplodia corticola]OJD37794.1 phosphatidylinositol phospholipase c protein [Diplodia corticola]